MNFPANQQTGNGIPAASTSRGLDSATHSQYPRGISEQDELEMAPLMSPSISSNSLSRSGLCGESTELAPLPGNAALAENQPCSVNSPSSSAAGDYVDMNSLINQERQGQDKAQAKGKRCPEVPDEDKHTYTNVDHRAEKAENLYEVLP